VLNRGALLVLLSCAVGNSQIYCKFVGYITLAVFWKLSRTIRDEGLMQQIADWLQKLGMSEYVERFAENRIDFSVLPDLNEHHLKDLGIALGDRLKLLRAIRELGGAAPISPSLSSSQPKIQELAERRQVTVMFSDLVGSTALSARMDPEDLREVISAYQKCVAESVRRFGGFVAKYMGDGVLVYFGYPEAHEDDAERAVRAGLELNAAVGTLKAPASLQARVGIATGLVVVGDLIGSGEAQERGIVGETPNLAARLQGTAEPNTVVIAEATRKLIGNLFELEDLGTKDLKGIGGPVQAWVALRPAAVSRFEALHASGLTALVGREEETEVLLRRWSRAKLGEGQVILLSGEAGIGKSRLTTALVECLASEPHTHLRYFCSPQHTDSAFYPIISQIARAAGLTHEDSAKERLDKLDALLAQTAASAEPAALFADMLSLPNDGRYPSLAALTPEQRRQRTLEALTSRMETLARQNPVLLIFEDAHWADPTSLEVFSRCVDRIATLRVLLIVTFRPEFEPPWIGRPYVTALTLNRLSQREVAGIIDQVVGNKLLAANVRQDIIERSDGIPLFIEEITKAVLEADSQGAAEQTIAAIRSPTRTVPASLHASLMARLDRLGAAKEVAQIGATIGREFSHALLAAVVREQGVDLQSALDCLMESGLLFRQGMPPHATYLFKHALVQDAAYGTLLREPRRALHARIAETIEGQFCGIAENEPELLARHCTEAGLIEKAALLWGRAGERSLQRSALVEAAQQLTRSLTHFAAIPGSPALRREELRLQVALIYPLMHLKGYAAPETKAAVARARLLIEQTDSFGDVSVDPMLLLSILFGSWVENLITFNGNVLRELATQFLTLAEKQQSKDALLVAHNVAGLSLLGTGAIAEGRAHLDLAIELYDPVQHRAQAMRFGPEIGVANRCWRAWARWLSGYPNAALSDAERAVTEAREIGHAATLMFALNITAVTLTHCGSLTAASVQLDEALALADEKGASFRKAQATFQQGHIAVLEGNAAMAIQRLTAGITAWQSTGATLWSPLYSALLARAEADLGRFDDTWRCIGEAMTIIEKTDERWCEAEVQRIAGEIALKSSQPPENSETFFKRALAITRKQQARSWELRAAMSMARLWRDQGKPQQAHELLAPVYGWFTEGFDTRDLKEAKALLGTLV
jgi:class 3 adenylate cyclase/tetratricopeptide (TPR) repeat protein